MEGGSTSSCILFFTWIHWIHTNYLNKYGFNTFPWKTEAPDLVSIFAFIVFLQRLRKILQLLQVYILSDLEIFWPEVAVAFSECLAWKERCDRWHLSSSLWSWSVSCNTQLYLIDNYSYNLHSLPALSLTLQVSLWMVCSLLLYFRQHHVQFAGHLARSWPWNY